MASVVLCAQSMASGMRGWVAIGFSAVLAFVQDIRRVKADRKVSLPLFMRFVVCFFFLYTSPLCWVVDAIHSERIWVYG